MDFDSSYAVAGALTGLAIGLTGVGGGALMTPILLLVFGISPTTAIATDLWFAACTKIAAVRIHHTRGNVDWEIARRLWYGSLPMAVLVVAAVGFGFRLHKSAWLGQAVGVVVLVTAVGLLLAPWLWQWARHRRLTEAARFKAAQPAMTVVFGALLGLCVALTSVGAGALGSVILLHLYPLRMNPRRLIATDIVHAIPLAVVAGLGYLFAGLVDWAMLANLLLGSIPAVVVGSKLAGRVEERRLQIALAVVLLAAAWKTLG